MKLKILQRNLGSLIGICILLLCSLNLQAQEMTVSGTVTGDDGDGLPGATVQIKGTNTGTITDINGKYSINANMGDVLLISFVGLNSEEIVVSSSTHDVQMEADAQLLDELIVIGYGAQRKKEVTGAVAHVKGETLRTLVTSDIAKALQGQIAGVSVTNSSGQPGANASVQIRGFSSVVGANEPLYVVDGIPQDGDPRLSANEIESIDVLKDAASASIYGIRGGAGVILITTRQGKEGITKINYDQSYGINKLNDGINLMNADQQLYFDNARYLYANGNQPNYDNRPHWLLNDTNLSDFVLVDEAVTQNYNVNVGGGTKDLTYNVVLGHYNQEGVVINSGFKRYNFRANARVIKDKWTVKAVIGYTSDVTDVTNGGLLTQAIRYSPLQPAIDIESEVIEVSGGGSQTPADNVLQRLKNKNERIQDRINLNFSIGHNFTKDLKLESQIGASITNRTDRGFTPPYAISDIADGTLEIDPTKSLVSRSVSKWNTLTSNTTLSYTKKLNDHKISAMASLSLDNRTFQYFGASRQGVTNADIEVLNGGTISESAFSGAAGTGLQDYVIKSIGVIGRILYDYKGKYLASVSVRRDGSSKFGFENQYQTFPSVSVGWNISDEPFWAPISDISDNMKIRASYGTVGNESFAPYRAATVVEQERDYLFGTYLALGTAQRQFANPEVQWETTKQANLGLDLGLFRNKVTFTFDYYDTQKEDMLFNIVVPGSAGALPTEGNNPSNNSVTLNVGNMTNKGIEMTLGYAGNVKGLKYRINGTFSRNRNEITQINNTTTFQLNRTSALITGDGTSLTTALSVGHEAGAYFLFETGGVADTQEKLEAYRGHQPTANLGDLIINDINQDSVINDLDRVYKGSGQPDFELGANFNFRFKGFDLDVQWYAAVGHEVLNGGKAYAYTFGRHADLLDMWTPANPDGQLPIYRGDSKTQFNYDGDTDLFLEDGSYLRLRNIVFGYTLPKSLNKKIGMDRVRIYVSAQNPLTFTNYSGYDPEIGGSITTRGLDRGRYPAAQQYLMGLQLNF